MKIIEAYASFMYNYDCQKSFIKRVIETYKELRADKITDPYAHTGHAWAHIWKNNVLVAKAHTRREKYEILKIYYCPK